MYLWRGNRISDVIVDDDALLSKKIEAILLLA